GAGMIARTDRVCRFLLVDVHLGAARVHLKPALVYPPAAARHLITPAREGMDKAILVLIVLDGSSHCRRRKRSSHAYMLIVAMNRRVACLALPGIDIRQLRGPNRRGAPPARTPNQRSPCNSHYGDDSRPSSATQISDSNRPYPHPLVQRHKYLRIRSLTVAALFGAAIVSKRSYADKYGVMFSSI